MRTYAAGLHDKRIEVVANSLYEAKKKAIQVLKPKKPECNLLWVILADVRIFPDV